MKTFLSLLLAAIVMAGVMSCGAKKSGGIREIVLLDSLISRHDDLEKAKLIRIADLRHKKGMALSDADRYPANAMLFDEFVTYNSDSALKYADMNIGIALSSGNREWEITSKLNKAEVLAGSGLLAQAKDLMSSISPSGLSRLQLIAYYGQMVFLYSHLGNFTGGENNDYYVLEKMYKDSVMAVINVDHPEYLWYRGWNALGSEKNDPEVIDMLRSKLAESHLNTRQDAKDAYILAKLYEESGDKENSKRYMAMSAIADVKTVNAEIASLEDLAKMMFGEDDIDHAYSYIQYSLGKAIAYRNRVKAFGMSETLDEIYSAYQGRNREQQRHMQGSLLLVCILAVVLTGAVVVIILQNSKLRKQRHNLDDTNKTLSSNLKQLSEAQANLHWANGRLQELNKNLKLKNEELNEANYVKEEYIGSVFTICSNYIGKLQDLRRDIHRKALAKKYKEIEEKTADLDMKDELKDFFRSFDSIFLHIYPNFVADFNTLLQEDKQIFPKDGELLNTDLRIYALVRLGITDSVKIAEFLHCSPQTVYNNRFKVRNKAVISKKDFAEAVRTLGKFQGPTS